MTMVDSRTGLTGAARHAQEIANRSYREALHNRSTTPAAVAAPSVADTPAATTTPILQNASTILNTFLQGIPGLFTLDPNGLLATWISSQSSVYAGQGMSAGDIVNQIEATINNPAASGDKAAQQVFDTIFPGYNQKIQNGTTNANGNYTGLAGYVQYASQIQQFAQTAGLVPGTINASDIGDLWAQDVSAQEVSERLTTDYVNASRAWTDIPGFAEAMQAQGMTSVNQLASYYLNPKNTLNQINQQISAAQLGAGSGTTGFGNLDAAKAAALSAFLTNSGQSQLTAAQANQFFSGSIGSGVPGGLSIAAAANAGFEQAGPGTAAGPGVVSQDELIAAGEGNAAATSAVRRAVETRTASSSGGGGFAAGQGGVAGAGYGQ